MQTNVFSTKILTRMHACWRAANYLWVVQIYLYDNPLLKRPVKQSDVKPLVVGHWGVSPALHAIKVEPQAKLAATHDG